MTVAKDNHCQGGAVQVPDIGNNLEGFLASVVARRTAHGSPHCPWHLNVASGQIINLTLFDFRPSAARPNTNAIGSPVSLSGSAVSSSGACEYGMSIREGDGDEPLVLCDRRALSLSSSAHPSASGGVTKQRISYKSKTNDVYVNFLTPEFVQDDRFLIIHYKGECVMLSILKCILR